MIIEQKNQSWESSYNSINDFCFCRGNRCAERWLVHIMLSLSPRNSWASKSGPINKLKWEIVEVEPRHLSIHQRQTLISTILSPCPSYTCAHHVWLFSLSERQVASSRMRPQRWCWWVSLRNWRRHPAVTFYSLTLADYRQLMHNKYTPLRVHYHLINISPWRWRVGRGLAKWGCICVTDVCLWLRGSEGK